MTNLMDITVITYTDFCMLSDSHILARLNTTCTPQVEYSAKVEGYKLSTDPSSRVTVSLEDGRTFTTDLLVTFVLNKFTLCIFSILVNVVFKNNFCKLFCTVCIFNHIICIIYGIYLKSWHIHNNYQSIAVDHHAAKISGWK